MPPFDNMIFRPLLFIDNEFDGVGNPLRSSLRSPSGRSSSSDVGVSVIVAKV